jgi:beta-glucanase (GH16 family)
LLLPRVDHKAVSRISRQVVFLLVLAGMLTWAMPALATGGSAGHAVRHRHRSAKVRHRRRSAAVRHAVKQSRPKATAASLTSAPSGVAMPVGNIPGWHEAFSDDFTGSKLDWQWTSYWGVPGGDPGGFFDPTHVTVSGGQLGISAYKDPSDIAWDAGANTYVTGGVSSSPSFAQTYGKYLVRFKFGAGVGISHAILLWPQSNTWPPEIDFSEDNGSNRKTTYATLHYGANNTQVQRSVAVNLTQWHTLGVEWTPGRLVYTLDGKNWATVANANVPSTPMNLDIQTQSWACGTSTWEQCPNATTPSHVNLSVDWVVAYSWG